MKPSGPAMTQRRRIPSLAYTSYQAVGGPLDGDDPLVGEGAAGGAGEGVALGGQSDGDGVKGLPLGVDVQAATNSEAYTTRVSSFIGRRMTRRMEWLLLDAIP